MRSDVQAHDPIESADGNDVPGVTRDNVGGEESDLRGGVSAFEAAAAGGSDAVIVAAHHGDRFDLHAKQARAGIDHEIVASGVAVRFGDGKAESGGAAEKAQFGQLALG